MGLHTFSDTTCSFDYQKEQSTTFQRESKTFREGEYN